MKNCYLPIQNNFDNFTLSNNESFARLFAFEVELKQCIKTILGGTFLLPEVIAEFQRFGNETGKLVNPNFEIDQSQIIGNPNGIKFHLYDQYFEVIRINEMALNQLVEQYLSSAYQLINEVVYTSMSRGELAYILKGFEAANNVLLTFKNNNNADYQQFANVFSPPESVENRAIFRWKLAHHNFAIFALLSDYCFTKATKKVENSEFDNDLALFIDQAAHLHRATSGCMEFGNSFTATIYRTIVRRDMSEANEKNNLPNGFSGTQNFEYVQWRNKKNTFLKIYKLAKYEGKIPENIQEKVELFRAFYLEDMHVHSIIAGRMVGIEKSLLQEGISAKGREIKVTAGDMLRMMASKREEETKFIIE
jgi:hypothetical protein